MKRLLASSVFCALGFLARAQEITPKWDVELSAPATDVAPSEPAPKPDPIDFEVLSSRTTQIEVKSAAAMPDLPSVEGTINVTVQKVADPGLPDPTLPLPALPADAEAMTRGLAEVGASNRETKLAFISASVYDSQRTLLRVSTTGKIEDTVTAWSNVNFIYFTGNAGYSVKHSDGSIEAHSLVMGASPIYRDEAPEIPNLPDLSAGGPSFVVVEGDANSAAMDTLEQVHELYRKEGAIMKASYLAREQALAERKAFLLANPPQPKDIVIRHWRTGGKSLKPKLQVGQ